MEYYELNLMSELNLFQPTFQFYKKGKVTAQMTGADPTKLKEMVAGSQYYAKYRKKWRIFTSYICGDVASLFLISGATLD